MRRGLAGYVLGVGLALGCGGSTLATPNDGGAGGGGGNAGGGGGPDGGPLSSFAQLRFTGVDKVDLLFMIDNSASMGDKQEFLAKAVPDLLGRLINPYCTDANGSTEDASGNLYGSSNFGDCSSVTAAGAGSKPEFTAVHDMHVGIVTSSLGSYGANSCPETGTGSLNPVDTALSAHNNDQGHLIDRGDPSFDPASPQEVTVADAAPSGFLAWFPNVPANAGQTQPVDPPITDQTKLIADFQEMVQGVHEYGCGLESQLESWYRFLVQPDPYATIPVASTTNGRAQPQGVDSTILQQRHDFLRPDSVVAIVLLSDENDSGMDPWWYGGQGWAFNNLGFPGSPSNGAPKGTSACQTTPSDPSCTSASCAFCTAATQADPNCGGPCVGNQAPAAGYWSAQEDNVNLRHVHMRAKYGVDPQYPLSRYVNGLTGAKVPNRACEHNDNCKDSNANNWQASSVYVGDNNAICTNPLFAASLPTAATDDPNSPTSSYCTLAPGQRTPDLVFFAAITGVPSQLLHYVPGSPAKSALTDGDWVSILGQGPATDPTQAGLTDVIAGIDPHMIESNVPRGNGIPTDQNLCNPSNGTCSDDIVGSDWNSQLQDLMFACTFPFANGLVKDCTQPQYVNACDCENGFLPPLCTGANNTEQNRGKAYPGIRELALARALKNQATVASICPEEVNDATSPVYGYRPAMEGLVDRMKSGLGTPCLPQALPQNAAGCELIASVPVPGPESTCTSYPGLAPPDPATLSAFLAQEEAVWTAAGGQGSGLPDPAQFPACQVNQIQGVAPGTTCEGSSTPGWCYVTNAPGQAVGPAGACQQALVFSQRSLPPTGSTVYIGCP